jgi:hypothetical protein
VAEAEPGTPILIDVLGNDRHGGADFDPASLQIIVPPVHGSAMVTDDGRISYLVEEALREPDRFEYEICDTRGGCAVAVVTIHQAASAGCPVDAVTIESFTIDPAQARPQDHVEVTLQAGEDPEHCPLPIVQLLFDGAAWGAPAGFSNGSVTVGLSIPADAASGDHTVTAVARGTSAELATLQLAVIAAPAAPESSGTTDSWLWIPIGLVGVGAAGLLWRRRVVRARRITELRAAATSAAERAALLETHARACEADLQDCEVRHHRSIGVLPTALTSGEGPGGTTPYLLDYENPNAPVQDDGRHGWYYPRRKEPIRGIVVHTPGGLALPAATADHVARYLATCRNPASAHAVVDARGVITLLPETYTALHIPAANSASLGLIVCLGDDPGEQQAALIHAARWCRVMADAHDLPMTRIDADTWRTGGLGIMGHSDLDPTANDPAGPANTVFAWTMLLEADPGPSTFPGAVPVKLRPGPDPCAAERQRATEARTKAAEAQAHADGTADRVRKNPTRH